MSVESVVTIVAMGFAACIGIGIIIFVAIPWWVQCPKCLTRIASVKVGPIADLSSAEYEAAAGNRLYGGRRVCSGCWEALEDLGFRTTGNWAPGAIVEYLKTTPNFIAIFISVGALVVSIIALLRP